MVIESRQLTKDSLRSIMLWIDDNGGKWDEWCWDEDDDQFIVERYLAIATFEGIVKAQENDWVIKGLSGEFYPCKPDIFEMTYESVDGLELPEKVQTHVHASDTSSERVNKTEKSEHEDWYGQWQWQCGYERGWDKAMERELVGLSDEEILGVWQKAMVEDNGKHARLDNQPFVHFARAIEAKLKDKNT